MALHGIGSQMRVILSGTPLQNNLTERKLLPPTPWNYSQLTLSLLTSLGSHPFPDASNFHSDHHQAFQGRVQFDSWVVRPSLLKEESKAFGTDHAEED